MEPKIKLPLDVSRTGLTRTNVNPTPGEKFAAGLKSVVGAVSGVLGVAAPFMPAAAVMSTALRGVASTAGAALSGGGGVDAFGGSANFVPGAGGGSPYDNLFGGSGPAGGGVGSVLSTLFGGGGGGGGVVGSVLGSVLGGGGGGGFGGFGGGDQSQILGMQGALGGGDQRQLQLLAIQREMEEKSEMFSTMSNIMNARHSMSQSIIQNIK